MTRQAMIVIWLAVFISILNAATIIATSSGQIRVLYQNGGQIKPQLRTHDLIISNDKAFSTLAVSGTGDTSDPDHPELPICSTWIAIPTTCGYRGHCELQ